MPFMPTVCGDTNNVESENRNIAHLFIAIQPKLTGIKTDCIKTENVSLCSLFLLVKVV